MNHPIAEKIEKANLERTRYLLQNWFRFQTLSYPFLDLPTSQAILSILSYSLSDHDTVMKRDFDLINRCGAFLPPAVSAAAETIKQFPPDIAGAVYTVLYHQYLHPDGPAVDSRQLIERVQADGMDADKETIYQNLYDAERMMSTLLFPNSFVNAIHLCS